MRDGRGERRNSEGRFLQELDAEAARTGDYNRLSVMALLTNPNGEVLLNLRDDSPDVLHPGHWAILGGSVEEGEDLIDALHREVREEIGYSLDDAVEFCRIIDWEGGRDLVVVYSAPIGTPIDQLRLGEGREIRFFPPGTIGGLLVSPFVRRVLRAYFQEENPRRRQP